MRDLGISALISKIPFVEVKDIVSKVLSTERRIACGAAVILGTFVNNYNAMPKVLDEDVSVLEKSFYIASFALPLALYYQGVQALGRLTTPMPAFSFFEMQLIQKIGSTLVKEGAPTENCLADLFMYAFANERFCKRFAKVIEQNDPEMIAKFYNYHEVLYQFTYNTQGLTRAIVKSLSNKLNNEETLTFQELVWVERLSIIKLDDCTVKCITQAADEISLQSSEAAGLESLGISLESNSSIFEFKAVLDLIKLSQEYMESAKINFHNAPLGSILVFDENKLSVFVDHYTTMNESSNQIYNHTAIVSGKSENKVKAFDISYEGTQVKEKGSLCSALCIEVCTIDWSLLITKTLHEKVKESNMVVASIEEDINALYLEQIEELAAFHSRNPHRENMKAEVKKRTNGKKTLEDLSHTKSLDLQNTDNPYYLRCAGTFTRFYSYLNKFTLEQGSEDRSHFDVGQPITCGAFTAKIIEQAIININANIALAFDVDISEDPYTFVQSPFPSFINLDSLDPSDFMSLDTFKLSYAHLGNVKIKS